MAVMKKAKGITVLVMLLAGMGLATSASAQQPAATDTTQPPLAQPSGQTPTFSDGDLKQFVAANAKAVEAQKEAEKAMVAVLEEQKLSPAKFNEMAQALKEKKLQQVSATAEEKAAFNKAAQQLVQLQPQLEQKIQQSIQSSGITLEKYQAIRLAYDQNPAIQAKVNQLIQPK
jgi:hypothetical protein